MNKLLLTGALAAACAVPAVAQMATGGHMAGMGQPLTRADAEAKVRAHFAKADANHDGYVTRDEIHGAMQGVMARHGAEAFDEIDANHDGSISRDEFAAYHGRRGPPMAETMDMRMPAPPMEGAAPSDSPAMHRMMIVRHEDGPHGAMMLVMADADHDGRLSLKEAVDATLAHFDKADANHDGTLTPEERHAAMAAMMPPPPVR